MYFGIDNCYQNMLYYKNNKENTMAQLNTAQDILQYAKEQTGITQQESVGGSLYCEMIDADQAEWFRKDLQQKMDSNTEVKMYALGKGVNQNRQEYVYDFVPKAEPIPPEVEHMVELEAEIARGK
jgi:hypothetical protein